MEHKPASVSEATECRITFIIGNGFDLNLQMKTRYADIYESYVTSPSRTSVIAEFKKDLGNYSQCNKWADFEMGMAEYARTLPDENSFVECIRDFKKHMVDYLEVENERIAEKIFSPNNEPRVVFALEKALHHFHERLTPNAMNQIADLWHNKGKRFRFLTFNYTDTLSFLFSAAEEYLQIYCKLTDVEFSPDILHIHGSLTKDVVLGVDNEDQLKDLPYSLSARGKRAFIKPHFNEQYDVQRIIQARKTIIDSSLICIFGFSLGDSDQMWVDCLADWLHADTSHHLVYFEYDSNEYARCNFDELMDAEDEKKTKLLRRFGFAPKDRVGSQIHVPIGDSIFDFELKEKVEDIEDELPSKL